MIIVCITIFYTDGTLILLFKVTDNLKIMRVIWMTDPVLNTLDKEQANQ